MQNSNKLHLLRSIKGNLTDITEGIAEAGLDQFLEDSLLKDIPIIGTIFKVLESGKQISDAFFIKKIIKFIHELSSISEDERNKFLVKLESEKEQQRINEQLLIYISRFETADKSSYLGKIFKSYLKGEIDKENFMRFSNIIDKIYIEDLKAFFKTEGETGIGQKESLMALGLYTIETKEIVRGRTAIVGPLRKPEITDVIIIYKVSDLGNEFLKLKLHPSSKIG